MDYSFVIPAYNEELLLPNTLKILNTILLEISDFKGELIVVDNNSTDNTGAVAESYNATVVFEGFQQISSSRNAGAKAANGKYLIFVDADTIIAKELVLASLTLLESKLSVGGGAIAKFDSSDKMGETLCNWWNKMAIKLKVACGAYMFCSKQDFIEVGGFNENVYASEEIWFGRKLKKLAKTRQQTFNIIPILIETSARKMEWYGPWKLFVMFFPILIFPWLVRNKKFCDLWYKRPNKE